MADRTIFTVYQAGPGREVARLDRLLPIPPEGSGVDILDADDGQESYGVLRTVLDVNVVTGDVTLRVMLR